MRSYHLFAGSKYYPGKTFEDYRGAFPTLEEAKAAFVADVCTLDWAHVVWVNDHGELELVAKAELNWGTNEVTWT